MDYGWVALTLSGGIVLQSVARIFTSLYLGRIEARIKHGDEFIEVNLEKPEQAELFIRDYLSRYRYSDVRARE
ncbi:MAG: hypothetical protein JO115_25280 [Pseudonocardiales bacterium]|nr:hypothetical protein [Pseudonocardiales bacterium]